MQVEEKVKQVMTFILIIFPLLIWVVVKNRVPKFVNVAVTDLTIYLYPFFGMFTKL
jgi:hypothetical protein